MNVSFTGIHEHVATFETPSAVTAGTFVKMTGNGTVGPCADTNPVCGYVLGALPGYAVVQLSGYCKAKYTGTAPVVGHQLLAADGNGNIKAVGTGGRQYLIIDVDTSAKTVGFIL